MDTTFGDQLAQLWEEHDARLTRDEEKFWRSNREAFRLRLADAARRMFGDLALLLTWKVLPGFSETLRARADIPGYPVHLEWSPDITGLYGFRAWINDPDSGVRSHHVDGRLKLGAILWGQGGRESEEA